MFQGNPRALRRNHPTQAHICKSALTDGAFGAHLRDQKGGD